MKRFLASLLLMVFMMPFALQALEGGGADSKFFYDFNDGSIAGWKTVDRDNDGYCWLISGDGYIYSESSELLKPNNIFTTTSLQQQQNILSIQHQKSLLMYVLWILKNLLKSMASALLIL